MNEIEKKLVVERKFDEYSYMVRFRCRVATEIAIPATSDDSIPSKFIAGSLANSLREYVFDAKLADEIEERL